MVQQIVQVVSVAVLVGSFTTVLSQNDDYRCIPANDTNVSCGFSDGLCGWHSVGNSEWKMKRAETDEDEFDYASVNTTGLPVNSSSRLESPLLCAVERGAYLFSFYYLLPDQDQDNCRLSLLLSNEDSTSSVKIWTATSADRDSGKIRVSPLIIRCAGGPFQIYFEAEKLSGETCSNGEMGIDNIKIKHSTTLGGTFTACPLMPPQSHKSSCSNNGGYLGGGAVAGIVIGILVFVVIVIVFVIAKRRWNREKGATSSTFKFSKGSQTENPRSPDEAASNMSFHQYEPTPGLGTSGSGSQHDYDLASVPAGHYITPHTAPAHVGTRGPQGATPWSVGDASDGYNELTFKTQHSVQGARTYDHLKDPKKISTR